MATAVPTTPTALHAPSPPRILAVVHDHGIRDAVAVALAGEGYDLVTSEHGADALAQVGRWQPRVILLDMRLPATDGGAAMARYRQAAGPGVAIIGLAGFPVHDTAAQAAQIGADAGLAMPFDPDEMRTLVRRHATHPAAAGAAGAAEGRDEDAAHHAGREAPAVAEAAAVGGTASGGTAAIVDVLRAGAAQPGRHTPWMTASVLAATVGAAGVHDPQFEADMEALYAAGTIRLMSGEKAGGTSFYEAMLVPPTMASDEAAEAMPIPVD